MGKNAKTHRAKVQKRNLKIKHDENKMKKEWSSAFEEQMEKMKEQFQSMSGDSMSGLTELLGDFDDKELRDLYPLNVEGSDMPIDLKEMELSNTEIVTEDEQK